MSRRDFTAGSLPRHVVAMSAMSIAGLAAIYVGDLLTAFYISLLRSPEKLAAFGYSMVLLALHTSVSVGFSVAVGARLSRMTGTAAPQHWLAATTAMTGAAIAFSTLLVVLSYAFLPFILNALGTTGQVVVAANEYCTIALLSRPPLTAGLCMVAALRARGDGRNAMLSTVSGAAASIVLDALLILVLDMGMRGAALANLLARTVLAVFSWGALVRIHGMPAMPSPTEMGRHGAVTMTTGLLASLTQLAAVCGNAIVMKAVGSHGVDFAAAWSVIERISAAVFVAPLALSGAIGPIVGQNFGLRLDGRVRTTMHVGLLFLSVYVAVLWVALILASEELALLFDLRGAGGQLFVFFCVWVAGRFLFLGAIFLCNAAFNYCARPLYATALSWAHATVGTLPFVWLGSKLAGPFGIVAGWGLGSAASGLIGIYLWFAVMRKPERAVS